MWTCLPAICLVSIFADNSIKQAEEGKVFIQNEDESIEDFIDRMLSLE